MIRKFLNPTNDFAFKQVFGTEKNKDILIHFLNDMLLFKDMAKIKDVQFLPTIQDPKIAIHKRSIVDISCEDEAGRRHIVEMQVAESEGFEKRAQYYAAKAYCSQLAKGEPYCDLQEVIFLAVTNFVMFPEIAAYKSDHIILDKDTYQNYLQDFSFTFLELPKFNKGILELNTIVEKWAYFLKNAGATKPEELPTIIGEHKIIERAYQAVSQANWNEEELNAYEQMEKIIRDHQSILARQHKIGWEAGQAKGRAEGIQQGEKNKALAVAKNMLIEGFDKLTIMKVTGLSEEALAKLDYVDVY